VVGAAPHVQYGTLEVRVPDAQATIEDAAGVAEFTHALVAWLAARFDGGERLPVHEGWRIDENRWSAARNGVEGELADLDSGERIPARDRLLQVIDTIAPFEREGLMADTRRLLTYPGPGKQRQAAMTGGAKGVAEWLAGVYRPTTL
jgi:carboxylate-amine ligase